MPQNVKMSLAYELPKRIMIRPELPRSPHVGLLPEGNPDQRWRLP